MIFRLRIEKISDFMGSQKTIHENNSFYYVRNRVYIKCINKRSNSIKITSKEEKEEKRDIKKMYRIKVENRQRREKKNQKGFPAQAASLALFFHR